MGWNFRKSIKIGPARVNLSKSGIGYSFGFGGLRYTKSPKKRKSAQKTSIKQSSSPKGKTAPRRIEAAAAASPEIERSWPLAIATAILAFAIVGFVSAAIAFACFGVAYVLGARLSSDFLSYILVLGIPAALALTAAIFAFLSLRPEKQSVEGNTEE